MLSGSGIGRRSLVALALLTGATLGLSACGGNDDASGAASAPAGSPSAQDCQLLGGVAIDLPSAVSYYKVDGKQESLEIRDSTSTGDLLTDPTLKKLYEQIDANNKAFSAADDDAARNEVLPKAKKTYQEFMDVCGPSLDDQNKEVFQSYLTNFPTTMPKPEVEAEPSKPAEKVDITKVGTSVKVGDPVIAEFTDDQGHTGPVKLTVTKVEVAPEGDKKYIEEESRDDVAQIVYVHLSAENAEAISMTTPSVSDVYPTLEIDTNDGSDGGSFFSVGSFGKCKDGSSAEKVKTFCKAFPLAAKSTKVKDVKLTGLTIKGDKVDDGLYTWTN